MESWVDNVLVVNIVVHFYDDIASKQWVKWSLYYYCNLIKACERGSEGMTTSSGFCW